MFTDPDVAVATNAAFGFSRPEIEKRLGDITVEYTAAIDALLLAAKAPSTSDLNPPLSSDAIFARSFGALADADGRAAAAGWRCTLPALVSVDAEARMAGVAAKRALKDVFLDTYMREDVFCFLMAESNEFDDAVAREGSSDGSATEEEPADGDGGQVSCCRSAAD